MDSVLQNARETVQRAAAEWNAKLDECRQSVASAQAQIESAQQAAQKAANAGNVKAYQKAMNDEQSAGVALDFSKNYLQTVKDARCMSEDDANDLIETVFRYEDAAQDDYVNNAAVHIAALLALDAEYRAKIDDSRSVLSDIFGTARGYTRGLDGSYKCVSPIVARNTYRDMDKANDITNALRAFKNIRWLFDAE